MPGMLSFLTGPIAPRRPVDVALAIREALYDPEILDGLDAAEAAQTVADILRPLGTTAEQRAALAAGIVAVLAATDIALRLEAGAHVVMAEVEDGRLFVAIDGVDAFSLETAYLAR